MIGIILNQTSVAVGNALEGQLCWRADDRRLPDQLSVAIEWELNTEQPRRLFGVARHLTWNAPADHEVTLPFRLLIPLEGPISYAGKMLSVRWTIKAAAVMRYATDETVESEIEVIPRTFTAT
ncbi:MAG: hypothetical protein M3041_14465 [Acidobacteriota bacterium]|nr:hypothetical protein [Acidobacteriota bacterium]